MATLPPIEQISNDDGSGGYQSPSLPAASLTSLLNAPGSTTATWQAVSISIAVIRSRLSTIPPSTATRAAREAAARAPRDHRNTVGGGPPHGGLHLPCVLGPDDGRGRAGGRVVGPVMAVLLHGIGVGDHHTVGQRLPQLVDRLRVQGHEVMQPRTTRPSGPAQALMPAGAPISRSIRTASSIGVGSRPKVRCAALESSTNGPRNWCWVSRSSLAIGLTSPAAQRTA